MGFFNAMKGANNAWGSIICAEGIGTIGPENLVKNTSHTLMITLGLNTFTISKQDIASVKIIDSTSEWIKYLISLKNGKTYVAIFMMTAPTNNKSNSLSASNTGKKINMAVQNFEWWMYDFLYPKETIKNTPSTSNPSSSDPVKQKKSSALDDLYKDEEKPKKSSALDDLYKDEEKPKESAIDTAIDKETSAFNDVKEKATPKTTLNEEEKVSIYAFAVMMFEQHSYEVAYNSFIKIKGYADTDEYLAKLKTILE